MKTRPFVPALDELQRLLNVENPGDLPDAVRELLAQAESAPKIRRAIDGLLVKLAEEIEQE